MIGSRLGPYEIVAAVGAGGMGEVYRARDPRLGRDVAIKVLPLEFAADPDRLRRFEHEARAVAALDHPNILAIHDVGTHEGAPFLVSELLEGETLRDRLKSGGLTVRKAVETAVRIAQGLAAAHEKGIVHRDLKPANVFITKDGYVKILDFGIAKLTRTDPGPQAPTLTPEPSTETGGILGTVGYMSPEQVRGLPADHRTDIFSFGCVLYEMLSGRSPFRKESTAETMTAILHDDPPALAGIGREIPQTLEGIVTRCLEKRPEDRFTSARDLGFALQAVAESAPREVARRPAEPRPYPGLSAFTEEDAEHFFGRDAEVGELWRRIAERPLLAVIGPSGAGKTSFLRAGTIPHAPAGWRVVICTPGQSPFAALARSLAPAFAGDPEAIQRLLDFHASGVALGLMAQWRARADHGLVIVDQFEELFTLNAEDVQRRFAELLGRIAALDGLHVLLAMRDDFLFGCHAHRALGGVFEGITPLGPPSREDLRRALVEPARALGFAFEDDGLVDEMLDAVEGERGALPLLAFAVARLWEERDRERRLLTREAYGRIGGVAGALAQHAEATLERIGTDKLPLVRELFRNLVTAEGTRAVRDVDELSTVVPEGQRADADAILRTLIDARLLTSYEAHATEPGQAAGRRVEVVHESLLSAWPRLVRWRTEDEGGAQLRDQLRQAARLWEEKGKPDDLLWTGTSYQEYQVWRARYPGGLSESEETFARAMAARAGHRRRVRRMVVAAGFVAIVVVATGLGILLRRSVRATHRAEEEAGQREAAQVLALGRLRLADHPNGALAYAIASLERADNGPARRFAVEALAQGPPAIYLPPDPAYPQSVAWSPDGRWLALSGPIGLILLSRETGERRQFSSSQDFPVGFTSDGGRLVTDAASGAPTILHVWTIPEGRLVRTLRYVEESNTALVADHLVNFARDHQAPQGQWSGPVRRVPLDGSAGELLGQWKPQGLRGFCGIDAKGKWIVSLQGGRIVQQRLDALSAPPRVLGTHEGDARVWAGPWRDRVATGDSGGEVRIWDVSAARLERTLKSPADARRIALDPMGRYMATGPSQGFPPRSRFLFDLAAPGTAEPVPLLGGEYGWLNAMGFSPDGSWLATVNVANLTLWNLRCARSIVLGRQEPPFTVVAFTPDGHLLSTSDGGPVRRWPLSFAGGEGVRELLSGSGVALGYFLEVDPRGRFAVVSERLVGKVHLVPLDGSKPATYELKDRAAKARAGVNVRGFPRSLDPSGRFVAM
ncbi:MAG: protein kinase, partial [Thermoanaerobaculaceae bacterium]|nr:protein kinase [Thermoanaerobaculaceae bacterium]